MRIFEEGMWPHGLRCAADACVRLFSDGDLIYESWTDMGEYEGDSVLMVELICEECHG